MAFRWWAFRRFVFPHEHVRRQPAVVDPPVLPADAEPVARTDDPVGS